MSLTKSRGSVMISCPKPNVVRGQFPLPLRSGRFGRFSVLWTPDGIRHRSNDSPVLRDLINRLWEEHTDDVESICGTFQRVDVRLEQGLPCLPVVKIFRRVCSAHQFEVHHLSSTAAQAARDLVYI